MASETEKTMTVEASDELRESFEQQLRELLDGLYGAALRLTRDRADAEDLVAETVSKAVNRLGSLKYRGHLRAWMFRILTNTFISDCRKRSVRPEPEAWPGDEGEHEFSLFEKLHQPFMLWWGTPEQEFLNKVLRDDLERAVQGLPEAFRVVVVLSELQGFSYRETAGILEVPVGTVRSRLSRGRSLLQEALWHHAREAGLVPESVEEAVSADDTARRCAVILYADTAHCGRLAGGDEEKLEQCRRDCVDRLKAAIAGQDGRAQDFAGDAVLADFPSVHAALRCAVDVQKEIMAWHEAAPNERKVAFRIGINMGDVVVDRNDIYGDAVNVAARLEALAEPGGICVSGAVYDALGDESALDYEFMGEQAVKNIPDPVRAYRVAFGELSPVDESLARAPGR